MFRKEKGPGAANAKAPGTSSRKERSDPSRSAAAKSSPTSPTIAAALALAERWEIFPAKFVGKQKLSYKSKKYNDGKNWGATKDPDEIKIDFKRWPRAGIGIPTGGRNGIWVLEADTKEGHDVDGLAGLRALEAKYGALPETLMAESPSGSQHYYFNCPEGVAIKNSAGEVAPGVDVRGDGGMVVAPPSIRDDGAYRWLNELAIADAPPWLIELVRKNGSREPRRPEESEPVPEYLLGVGPVGISTDPRDVTPPVPLETIEAALEAIERNRYAGIDHKKWIGIGCGLLKELGEDKGFEVFHRWSKRGEDYNPKNFLEQWDSIVRANGYGWSIGTLLHLANEADPDWRLKIAAALENASQTESPKSEPPKSEPPKSAPATPYQGPLLFDPWAPFIVPVFPFDVLPPTLQEFVASQSNVIGGDPSALAMGVLAACSGAIDHRFSLKMMKHGTWIVHPRLWVLLVGPPSSRRTPLINAACAPLEAFQATLLRDHHNAMKEYERAKETGAKDIEKPKPPRRYVVWDSTIEKLGELLSREAKGLLIKRDEFAGLIGSMEKYAHGRGSAVDRAFYLKAYDGGPFSIDRIVRGEMYVENLSLSIIGGIQPDRLVELHSLASDGFLQRCLPTMMRPGELPQDRETDDVAYARLIRELVEAQPTDLTLTDVARGKLEELRAHLHSLEQASTGLWAGFNTFVGKLHGVAGSLALIMYIASNPKSDFFNRVDVSVIEKAQRVVVDFLIPHAFEFYRTAEAATNGDRLRQLASYLLTSGENRFTPSDFTRNVASMRGLSLREVNERVSVLVAAEWLFPDMRGLDNRSWKLNGYVTKQFAERRRVEEEQKAEIARLMGSPRRGTEL